MKLFKLLPFVLLLSFTFRGQAQTSITPSYPATLPAEQALPVACNNSITNLTSTISASSLTIPVTSTANFCPYQIVKIDSEYIEICSIPDSRTLLACTGGRGTDGSTPNQHRVYQTVDGVSRPALYTNVLRAYLKSMMTALGPNLQNVQTPLGFTPENIVHKGLANGYAALDSTGKVPSSQLPASTGGSGITGAPSTWPSFAAVATSGSYTDLLNKPTIPAAQVQTDWNAATGLGVILNKPALATVATSGAYSDLTGKPTIPAAQVQTDWNAGSGLGQLLNKPVLANIASTGRLASATELAVARTSSTVLTVGAGCSSSTPCNVRVGSVTYAISTPATATISSGTGTAYLWVDNTGNIQVASNVTLTCASCTAGVGTTFPSVNGTSFPLASWTATSGTWDATGTDWRASFGFSKPITAGPGILFTDTASSLQIYVDSSAITMSATNITFGTLPAGRLPLPAVASLGGVMSKDCTGTGHIQKINTDGTLTCSADAGGGGGITGPGTTTNNYIPQWSGTTGAALSAGLPLTTAAAVNSIIMTDSGGNTHLNNAYIDNQAISTYGVGFGTRLYGSLDTPTCAASAMTLNGESALHKGSLGNQTSCTVALANSTYTGMLQIILLCNGATTATTTLTWPATVKGGFAAGGTVNQCQGQTFLWDGAAFRPVGGASGWY